MMSIIDLAKKYLMLGLISQCVVTVVAMIVAVIEAFIGFFIGVLLSFIALDLFTVKYGPPPTPTPIPTPSPIGGSGPTIDPIAFFAVTGSIITAIVVLGSLLLYAWAVLGWVFWGSIMYLKMREK
ncbi:MAG TPA: hypothetical protein VK436_09205 [Methanocella sp.]|nr:hypothetical protein [Methanocella sp.]